MGAIVQSATNAAVLAFATARMGQRVGAGECWDLAEQALATANAKTSNDIMGWKNVTANADYKWGTPVNKDNLMPGDIIQFRDYKYQLDDGSYQTRPHHTAIVAFVWYYGTVDIIEQNVPQGGSVTKNTLYLTAGSFDGITVTIKGKIWCYRPIPKANPSVFGF